MKNIRLINRTFKKQTSENDCGIACLEMIFRYLNFDLDRLVRNDVRARAGQGLSLLDLKKLANNAGIGARCVRMELSYLYTISKPCILHVKNEMGADHFVVCYGPGRGEHARHFLIADPAGTLSFMPGSRLNELWQSNAGLYFEKLTPAAVGFRFLVRNGIFGLKVCPKELAFAIALLGVAIAAMGVAVSWVLQKGLDNSLTSGNGHYIRSLLTLLLLVTVFKCILTYVRNRILLKLNTAINKKLTGRLVDDITKDCIDKERVGNEIKVGLTEIRKMQHALSEIVAVIFTDGILLLFLLSGITWTHPLCGLINMLYLSVVIGVTWKRMPYQMLRYSELEELAIKVEIDMAQAVKLAAPDPMKQYAGYIDCIDHIGKKAGKRRLIFEFTGTINVVAAMSYGIVLLQQMAISYPAFMSLVLASYFITILGPNCCNAMYVAHEGSVISSRKASTYQK